MTILNQLFEDWKKENPDGADIYGPARLHGFGDWAQVGDIVEVIRGKNYPVGMKFIVNDYITLRFWGGAWHWHRNGDVFLKFIDEGRPAMIKGDYCKIIAIHEDRENNPLYADVHEVEIVGVN